MPDIKVELEKIFQHGLPELKDFEKRATVKLAESAARETDRSNAINKLTNGADRDMFPGSAKKDLQAVNTLKTDLDKLWNAQSTDERALSKYFQGLNEARDDHKANARVTKIIELDHKIREDKRQLGELRKEGETLVEEVVAGRQYAINNEQAQRTQTLGEVAVEGALTKNYGINLVEAQNAAPENKPHIEAMKDKPVVTKAETQKLAGEIKEIESRLNAAGKPAISPIDMLGNIGKEYIPEAERAKLEAKKEKLKENLKGQYDTIKAAAEKDMQTDANNGLSAKQIVNGNSFNANTVDVIAAVVPEVAADQKKANAEVEKAAQEAVKAAELLKEAKANALEGIKTSNEAKLNAALEYFKTEAGQAFINSKDSKDFRNEFSQTLYDRVQKDPQGLHDMLLEGKPGRQLSDTVLTGAASQYAAQLVDHVETEAAKSAFNQLDKESVQNVSQRMGRCGVQTVQYRTYGSDGMIDSCEISRKSPEEIRKILDINKDGDITRKDLEKLYNAIPEGAAREKAVGDLTTALRYAGITVKADASETIRPSSEMKSDKIAAKTKDNGMAV